MEVSLLCCLPGDRRLGVLIASPAALVSLSRIFTSSVFYVVSKHCIISLSKSVKVAGGGRERKREKKREKRYLLCLFDVRRLVPEKFRYLRVYIAEGGGCSPLEAVL